MARASVCPSRPAVQGSNETNPVANVCRARSRLRSVSGEPTRRSVPDRRPPSGPSGRSPGLDELDRTYRRPGYEAAVRAAVKPQPVALEGEGAQAREAGEVAEHGQRHHDQVDTDRNRDEPEGRDARGERRDDDDQGRTPVRRQSRAACAAGRPAVAGRTANDRRGVGARGTPTSCRRRPRPRTSGSWQPARDAGGKGPAPARSARRRARRS